MGTSFAIFRNELTLGGGAHTPGSARLWEEKHQQPSVSASWKRERLALEGGPQREYLGILRRSHFALIGLVLFGFLKERIKENGLKIKTVSVSRENMWLVHHKWVQLDIWTVGFEAGGGSESYMDRKYKESLKVQARPKLTPRYQTWAFGLDSQASGFYILNAFRMPVCGYVSKN